MTTADLQAADAERTAAQHAAFLMVENKALKDTIAQLQATLQAERSAHPQETK